jgi:hypothetical protein
MRRSTRSSSHLTSACPLPDDLRDDLHDDLQGEPGRAAAADERGDLVPVHLIGNRFGEGPGDPQLDQLAGPPVVYERLARVRIPGGRGVSRPC